MAKSICLIIFNYRQLLHQTSVSDTWVFTVQTNVNLAVIWMHKIRVESQSPQPQGHNCSDYNVYSVAIIRYLACEKVTPRTLYPENGKLQARVDEYLEWQHIGLRLHCAMYFRVKVQILYYLFYYFLSFEILVTTHWQGLGSFLGLFILHVS